MAKKSQDNNMVVLATAVLLAPRLREVSQTELDPKELRSEILGCIFIAQEISKLVPSANYAKEKARQKKNLDKYDRELTKAIKKVKAGTYPRKSVRLED